MSNDPNLEWLGHVQPVGLVVAARVLNERGLVPAEQTRADTEEVLGLLTEEGPALTDPWRFAETILGWPATHVAGAPGGPELDETISVYVPEAETHLRPDWAVAKPGGGWQILVQQLPLGVDPDKRGALEGWEATPHQRLERLLRDTGTPTGLLLSDTSWRLVQAPKGETSGWLTFPLRPMGTVTGRPMLGGLKLLLGRTRLFTDAEPNRLPALLTESRAAQAAVSSDLAGQVLGALHELLRGLHAADQGNVARLAQTRPAHVYEGLLTVLLRLIFLLYAEDRDLIPSRADGAARAFYERGYGVRGLHARLQEDTARNPDTMDERYGAWGRLLALFRLVHSGDGTGWIRGRGGDLFDPTRFPFLQGQADAVDTFSVPRISDGTVRRVLDLLLVLNGERLSYRTLDVEQIGSVYEAVMGFTVQPAHGPVLAIKAGKHNRTPVFVELDALLAVKGKERVKRLKEDFARSQLSKVQTVAIEAARDVAAMAEALRSIVDERGSPGGAIAMDGTPLLQPTDERRKTGSHYTPRSLTEPIVRHALEPAFERIGAKATPEEVLGLRVCDPAMGSGAFLVEACRQLASRLVAAWAVHPGSRPPIPADEDEDLLARRLVAQRCLYGVDRNPLAVDLARLSLWLATLARDHEFTFLDHALKSGDSLVGLTARQIGRLAWRDDQADFSPFDGFLRGRIADAVRARSEIQNAPDDIERAIQEQRHRHIEAQLDDIRLLGDAVIAAFFSADKPRARETARQQLGVWASLQPDVYWPRFRAYVAGLCDGLHPVKPFHWPVEFPEVFSGKEPGFDAIVGNPPFAGKNTLINGNRAYFLDWLQTLHESAHGNADLVAHFFRRAFALLRPGGCLGLIATNTIGQGDTRESGLRAVIEAGGSIIRAIRRLAWPGEAAVVVSVVHMLRGEGPSPVLDGRTVQRISAYLVEGDLDSNPLPLTTNAGKAFQGMILLGLGFIFDDDAAAKGKASPVSEMHRLIAKEARNAERIFPYLGGEELNNDPRHAYRRWTIDFNDFPLRRQTMVKTWAEMTEQEQSHCRTRGVVPTDYPEAVANDWPDLLAIVERLVKPERVPQKRDALRERWWQFGEKRPGLRGAVAAQERMIVISMVSPHLSFVMQPTGPIYTLNVTVIPDTRFSKLAVLQSRAHETWARAFSSTLEDRIKYSPQDAFRTFGFPQNGDDQPNVGLCGQRYHDHRAALMIARNEGLTKTYNRFHDAGEHARDIQRLRDLHREMDVAVLRAYGWDDLADTSAPIFLDETNEDDHRYQGRLFWPAPFREAVLARLLALNAERAAEERRAGLIPLTQEADVLEDDVA